MIKPAYITGSSIFSCLGKNEHSVVSKILAQRDGLSSQHRFQDLCPYPLGDAGISAESFESSIKKILSHMVEELNDQTGLFKHHKPKRIGFFIGTTTFGVNGFHDAVLKANQQGKHPIEFLGYNAQLEWPMHYIREKFPIRGPFGNIVTSCSSSAIALAHGFNLVRHGIIDACVAGGLDLLTENTVKGFDALQVLAKEKCQPFTNSNNGISLADGGALMLIEHDPNTSPQLKLLGHEILSEAYHMTNPRPGGEVMWKTMHHALQKAQLTPEEIDYISCHGTGTFSNDHNEEAAMARLFPETTFRESLKTWLGHTLAGSGALEISIVSRLVKYRTSSKKPKILKNSFGFGGSNISMVMEAV